MSLFCSSSASSIALAFLFVATANAEPPPPQTAPSQPDRKLELTSKDGAQRLRLGGQLQVDALTFPGDSSGQNTDDIRLRRARLDVRSQVANDYRLRMQLDFANSNLQIVDAYLELAHLEEIRLRIGKGKSPVSVDRGQSATNMHFLERGATNQTAPNRDLSVQVLGKIGGGLIDYQLGMFAGAPDGATSIESNADDRFDLVGRLTFQPLPGLEVGATWSYGIARGTSDAPQLGGGYRTSGRATWFRYRAGDELADTVVAAGERVRMGGHLLWHFGPLGVFGEVISSTQELALGGERMAATHLGWVGQVVVEVTGEDASFDGVTPNLGVSAGGPGAIELALRVHGIEIDDEVFTRGFADPERQAGSYLAFTFGATWYFDSQFKLQLNYERSTFSGGAADGLDRSTENLLGVRLQHLF